MKLQGADKNAAAAVLRTKALGIGEHHEKTEGRDLVLELLGVPTEDGNLVKHLFLEIMACQQPLVWAAAAKVGRNELQKNVEQTLDAAFQEGYRKRPLKEVAYRALLEGVQVHCVDCSLGRTPPRMKERNETIATRVKAVGLTDFSGCLLLYGGDHFDGNSPTLGELIDQMDWVICG